MVVIRMFAITRIYPLSQNPQVSKFNWDSSQNFGQLFWRKRALKRALKEKFSENLVEVKTEISSPTLEIICQNCFFVLALLNKRKRPFEKFDSNTEIDKKSLKLQIFMTSKICALQWHVFENLGKIEALFR